MGLVASALTFFVVSDYYEEVVAFNCCFVEPEGQMTPRCEQDRRGWIIPIKHFLDQRTQSSRSHVITFIF